MSEASQQGRKLGIGAVSAVALFVVLSTGIAGFVEAGLVEDGGWKRAAGQVLAPWIAAAILCALTVSIHAVVCRAVFIQYLDCVFSRRRLIIAMLVLLLAHAAEVQIFGLGIYAYSHLMNETLGGQAEGRLLDYLYFSYVTYTSLGLGDIYPENSLRLLVGLEALTGLLMIGWSASMTVVVFRREWFS